MAFEQLIPNVYYTDLTHGLKLFVDCLGFSIGHDELKSKEPFCVLKKDGLSLYLFQHATLAKEHNPEFRLVTKDIGEIYDKISRSHPELLHPNLDKVTLRPWGAHEFAIRDEQVCVIIQQW